MAGWTVARADFLPNTPQNSLTHHFRWILIIERVGGDGSGMLGFAGVVRATTGSGYLRGCGSEARKKRQTNQSSIAYSYCFVLAS